MKENRLLRKGGAYGRDPRDQTRSYNTGFCKKMKFTPKCKELAYALPLRVGYCLLEMLLVADTFGPPPARWRLLVGGSAGGGD